MSKHDILVLPDGAQIAYEVWGTQHIAQELPIVLVGGISTIRGDWDRLAHCLAATRPVLLVDYRGTGDSKFSTADGVNEITLESMARDLYAVVTRLKWKEVTLCGFSMGGVVVQYLLFLPYLPTNSTPLPFRVTHVVLAATFGAPFYDPRYGLKFSKGLFSGAKRTLEQKRELVRPSLEGCFTPQWLADPHNKERFEWWLSRMVVGRPSRVIRMQAIALKSFDFDELYRRLPNDTQVLIIHGKLDQVVPFSSAQSMFEKMPRSRMVEVGNLPGQVPDLDFGHNWFEYFDMRVWDDVFRQFLSKKLVPVVQARM